LILFWVICALMIVIALAFVLPPLLERSDDAEVVLDEERKQANIAVYRDQLSELEADLRNGIVAEDQYAQDRDEIERRLLEDVSTTRSKKKTATTASFDARSTAYLLGFGLPLIAVTLYWTTYRITHPAPVTESPSAMSAEAPPERTQAQIEANVGKLAERLKSNPNDLQGWTMLARSYSSMEKYSDAANAYAKATELNPKDANLWAEYAFASGMVTKSLAGKPSELINRALKIDPENPKALQLAGSAAFEAKDYNKAIDYWQRVLKKVPPGSEVAQAINERINEAKSLAASK
jgi:cytochrome c-type biogenesis protein CcmH